MRDYAETFSLCKATKRHLKFWHNSKDFEFLTSNVRIRFFWDELQESIARKRGFAPVKFLDKTSFWLHGLHNWLN